MKYSETPQLQPIVPAYHVRILDDEQLEQFKSATLEILEETGIHCPSEKAINIYADRQAAARRGVGGHVPRAALLHYGRALAGPRLESRWNGYVLRYRRQRHGDD
jgi:hypothetical protein